MLKNRINDKMYVIVIYLFKENMWKKEMYAISNAIHLISLVLPILEAHYNIKQSRDMHL